MAGFLSKIFGRTETKANDVSTLSSPAPWFLSWLRGGSVSSSGVVVSRDRALRDTTVLACLSIRAGDLAKLPVHVFLIRPDGGREIVDNHPLEKLLQRPNGWQTRLEFVEQMQSNVLLDGNAFAIVIRNQRGDPLSLIPMHQDQLTMRVSSEGDIFYQWRAVQQHEQALLQNVQNPVPASDVLHLRTIAINNGLFGISRLHAGRDAIGLSIALEEHSSKLFSQGARPGGVFQTDKRLSDPDFQRLSAQLSSFEGADNSGRTMILEEGLKWQAQMMTSVESQTIEARKMQIMQIAMHFDVPLHRIGQAADGKVGNAIIESNQQYLNNTLSGDAERWETKLAWMFSLPSNMEVKFDLDYFNRADIQTRYTAYRTGIVGMFITPNEVRRQEGLPDHPNGDTLYQPVNVAPIGFDPSKSGGDSSSGPGSDVTGAPAPGGDGDPTAVPPLK